VDQLIVQLAHTLSSHCPGQMKEVVDTVIREEVVTLKGEGVHHTCFTMAVNFWAQPHFDPDACLSIGNCLDEKGASVQGSEFWFPEYGFACTLGHGDVYIFDPTVQHCGCEPYGTGKRYTTALYLPNRTLNKNIRDRKDGFLMELRRKTVTKPRTPRK
jgi:hypothetical protein